MRSSNVSFLRVSALTLSLTSVVLACPTNEIPISATGSVYTENYQSGTAKLKVGSESDSKSITGSESPSIDEIIVFPNTSFTAEMTTSGLVAANPDFTSNVCSARISLNFPACFREFKVSGKTVKFPQGSNSVVTVTIDSETEATLTQVTNSDDTVENILKILKSSETCTVTSGEGNDVDVTPASYSITVVLGNANSGNISCSSPKTGSPDFGSGGNGGGGNRLGSIITAGGGSGSIAGFFSWKPTSVAQSTSDNSFVFKVLDDSLISEQIYQIAGDSNSPLRQVYKTDGTLVDIIVQNSSRFVRFYKVDQIGPKSGQFYTITATTPYKQVEIRQENPTTARYITSRDGVVDQDYSLIDDEANGIQSKIDNLHNEKSTTKFHADNGDELETSEEWYIESDGSETLVSRSRSRYRTINAKRVLVETVQDPNDLLPNYGRTEGIHLVDRTTYDANGEALCSISSDGSWSKDLITEADRAHYLARRIALMGATDATVDSLSISSWRNTAAPEDGILTNYTGVRASVQWSDGISESYTGDVLTSRSQSLYLPGANYTDIDSQTIEGLECSASYSWYGTGADDKRESSRSYRYPGDWDSVDDTPDEVHLRGKNFATERADGTRTTYLHDEGTYNASTKTFTVSVGGPAIRTRVIRGTATTPRGVVNKTTQSESIIDEFGNIVLERDYVYTGGSSYAALTTTVHGYNPESDERILSTRCLGDGSDVSTAVVVYQAEYTAHELVHSINEFGVKTHSHSHGPESTSTTEDGLMVLNNTTVSDADGRSSISTDANGLVSATKFEVAANGDQLDISISPSGSRFVSYTNTLGVNYKTEEQDAAGNVIVSNTSVETANAADNTITITETVTDHTQTPPAVRVTTSVRDMKGAVKSTNTTFNGGTIDTVYTYDDTTGRLKKTQLGDGSLQAPQVTEYDELGRAYRSGIDLDSTEGLQLASASDRISESDSYYELGSDGFYYQVSESYVYLSATNKVLTSQSKSRVDGRVSLSINPGDGSWARSETSVAAYDSSDPENPHKKVTISQTSSSISAAATQVYAGYNTLLETQQAKHAGTTTKTTYSYNLTGDKRLDTMTDELGIITKYSYIGQSLKADGTPDESYGAGQLDTLTQAFGTTDAVTTTNTYSPQGQVTTVRGTAQYPLDYTYTGFGEVKTLTTYRGANQTQPAVTTWNYHTATGLLENKQYADNQGPSYTYDDAGRLKIRTWARQVGGQPLTTTYGYTTSGQVNSIDYSDTTPDVTGMLYDRGGRLTDLTDASGVRSGMTYSDYGQRAIETYTGTGVLSGHDVTRVYTGSKLSSIASTLSAGNYNASYQYDPTTKRLDTVTQGSYLAQYVYQPETNQIQTLTHKHNTQSALVSSFGYDSLNRITYVSNVAGGNTVSAHGSVTQPITYDNLHRRKKIIREDGKFWEYGFNTKGEVTSGAKHFAGSTPANPQPMPGYQYGYAFDEIGNRLTATIGADHTGVGAETLSYTPNNLNQYTAYQSASSKWITGSAKANSDVFVNGLWTWRNSDLFAKKLSLSNATEPAVTALNVEAKLRNAGPAGETVVSSELGTLLSSPVNVSPQYDADGNLEQDGLWEYTWDAENRLISMHSRTTVPAAERKRLEYVYDSQSRRVQRQAYDYNPSTGSYQLSSTTKYLFDAWNCILELTTNNQQQTTTTKSYTWGLDLSGTFQGAGGVGGLLSMEVDGATYAYAYDVNGNVSALVNTADQTVSAKYDYDPFGKLIDKQGDLADTNSYRFSTKPEDEVTGINYYGYRWYDAGVGRWLNRDPVEESGGLTLYLLLSNNTPNYYDLYGLKGSGHHVVPWHIFNRKVSKEVQDFFDSDVARIFNKYYKSHNAKTLNGISHFKYSKLVKEALEEFLGEQAIRDMTLDQAKAFLRKINTLPSNNPISKFNSGVADEAANAMKKGLEAAAKSAAKRSLDNAISEGAEKVKKLGKNASKRFAVAGFLVSGYFFVDGQNNQGLANQVIDEITGAASMTPAANEVQFTFDLIKQKLNRSHPHIMGARVCDIFEQEVEVK